MTGDEAPSPVMTESGGSCPAGRFTYMAGLTTYRLLQKQLGRRDLKLLMLSELFESCSI
jgi:hypothetical protein